VAVLVLIGVLLVSASTPTQSESHGPVAAQGPLISPDSVIVRYVNERGSTMCEYLRVGANGKIIQGSANDLI